MALHRVMCLNVWRIGSGSIGNCDLVGVGIALLEEVCHHGGGLCGPICSSYTQCGTQSASAPVDQDVELSVVIFCLCSDNKASLETRGQS